VAAAGVTAFADTAGLPPIRLRDLRHTAASLALQAGVQLMVVSEQLGHSAIASRGGRSGRPRHPASRAARVP
jgi:integrase